AAIGEQLSPRRIDVNHELGDESVDRSATPPRLDRNAAGFHADGVVEAIGTLLARAAQCLEDAREAPEREKVLAVRALDAACGDTLLVEALVELRKTQVVRDRDPFEARFRLLHLHARGVDGEVERGRGDAAAPRERGALDRR